MAGLRHAPAGAVAADGNSSNAQSRVGRRDWAGDSRTFALLWGVPVALMMAAGSAGSPVPAAIWTLMLFWMGGVCLANARRCGRTHCRFTGPFLILMAMVVVAYASGTLPLGPHGWSILTGTTIVGATVLWWGSERLWGKFWPRHS